MAPSIGHKEICVDVPLVLPGKVYTLLTDHLVTRSGLESGSSQTGLDEWFYLNHFLCHDILILGKSSIKWRQRPDMAIAVDWNVNKTFLGQTQAII